MRWRPGPRLALALGLLCASAFIAASGLLRRPADSDGGSPWVAGGFTQARADSTQQASPPDGTSPFTIVAPRASIDTTLSRDVSGCAGARSTVWNPLAGVEYTGRIRIDLPPRYGGAIALFIGDTMPLDVDVETTEGDRIVMHGERLAPGPGLRVPPDFWLDDESPWSAPGHILHATIDALPERDLSVVVSLGRRAPRVVARLIGYPDDVRVPICAVPVVPGNTHFATGWYGEQSEGIAQHRWMRDVGAVLVSSGRDGSVTVRVRATPALSSDDEPTQLTLRVNDVLELPAVRMKEQAADYEWLVPDTAWVAGTNELLFTVSRTTMRGTRLMGMLLQSIELLHRE